jgi:hypothetical protein
MEAPSDHPQTLQSGRSGAAAADRPGDTAPVDHDGGPRRNGRGRLKLARRELTRRRLAWPVPRWPVLVEWATILLVAYLYAGSTLLDLDPRKLQQTGEQSEASTLLILTELSLRRYGEIPLWNPFMVTGFPFAGDLVSHFWYPLSTLPILIWGGINGMKVSTFLLFLVAGFGQWAFAHVFGVRGAFRLWAALAFMLSGGLALLNRVGWYVLLLGAVWFPACYASLWWAARRRDRRSLALAAACFAMVLVGNSAYYPIYLCVSAAVLLGTLVFLARGGERWRVLRRGLAVAALSIGLAAVTLVPLIDGVRYTRREAGPEPQQTGSQPIPYALINYVVSEPAWLDTAILGNKGGWNWFYLGALPLAALALVPLALGRRRRRHAVLALAAITVILIAWHANKYSPIGQIYRLIPFLYQLRFPGRLLIVAASPLVVLAAIGLQHLYRVARRWSLGFDIVLMTRGTLAASLRLQPQGLVALAFGLVLVLHVRDVFTVNRNFGFHQGTLEPKSFTALSWLKNFDPEVYYTNIGGGAILWKWTPAAYLLEMPVINFRYNRFVAHHDLNQLQRNQTLSFIARPKYQLADYDQPRPAGSELIRDFDGLGLWRLPDALPFAFSVRPANLESGLPVSSADVAPLRVRLDGPNRVIVDASGAGDGQMVVLVSDYPGWRLSVDGQPSPIVPVNGYLGAALLPGARIYSFEFRPAQAYIGVAISLIALLVLVGLLVFANGRPSWPMRRDRSSTE